MSVVHRHTQQPNSSLVVKEFWPEEDLPDTIKDATKLLKKAGYQIIGYTHGGARAIWENRKAGKTSIEIPNISPCGHLDKGTALQVARAVASASA